MRLFSIFLTFIFIGCQSKTEPVYDLSELQVGRSEGFVEALMTHYRTPGKENKEQLPPPPVGYAFFTVGATDGEDTIRILMNTVKELVKLSVLAKQPTDSTTIASIVKGVSLLVLNAEAKQKTSVIKPWASIDSITLKGKNFTLDSLFTESGMQKKNLEPSKQAYLIDALSNWGLLVVWDDYSATYNVRKIKDQN